jgi:hypothetical protein
MKTRIVLLLGLTLASIQAPAQSIYTPYSWTTIGGTYQLDLINDEVWGTGGYADGNGPSARFGDIGGVAVDAKGSLYVADPGNDVIRKMTLVGTNWVVTTLAGQPGVAGAKDGIGNKAQFSGPLGVAVDGAGRVFVADTDNNEIREIMPDGTVTTIAGDPSFSCNPEGGGCYRDGPGNQAVFNEPWSVAVDSQGNLYVADFGNDLIRKVTPPAAGTNVWQVSTLAGNINVLSGACSDCNGQGTQAGFDQPQGVAVDGNGNVYVADFNNNKIRKITPNGLVSDFAGATQPNATLTYPYNQAWYGSKDGPADVADFYSPAGVAVDGAGNVYVADCYNGEIRKVTPDGQVTTLGGKPTGISGPIPETPFPPYVNIAEAYADGVGSAARFYFPLGLAVDSSGNLYVADSGNCLIRKGVAQVVQVVALEVIQVIQDWSNSVPLIAGKDTYVRAHLQLPSPESEPVVVSGAVLYGTMSGYFTNAVTTPINPGDSLTVHTSNAASAANRGNIFNSLDFRLPSTWLRNSLQLQLAWPGGLQPTNVVPNDCTVQVTFSNAAVPQITFWDVQWTSTNGTKHQLGTNISTLASRVLSCYPVASVDARYDVLPLWWSREPPGFGNDKQTVAIVDELLATARAEDLDSLTHRIWFGAFQARPGAPVGRAISPPPGLTETTPTFVSCANVMGTYGVGRQSVSHELGHNLGLRHDVDASLYGTAQDSTGTYALGGCGNLDADCATGVITPACGTCVGPLNYAYPLFQPVLGYDRLKTTIGPMTNGDNSLIYGLDTFTLMTFPQNPVLSPVEIDPFPGDPNCYYDLMSYCRNGGPEERWPSSVTYTSLLSGINKVFGPPAAVPRGGPRPKGGGAVQNYLLARGSVDFIAGTAQFLPCLPLTTSNPPPTEMSGTNFTLEALDHTGAVLQMVQFSIQPDIGEEGDTNQIANFHLFLTATPSIHTLLLSYNGMALATLTASPEAPTLTLTSPNGAQNLTNGTLNVAWTGSDSGGETLVYMVQYSADNGATWKTLAVDWPDQSLEVDSSYLSATTQGLIRVVATDGINTTTAQSAATFTIPPHPPVVSINAPSDGSSFVGNQQLFLDASVQDMQDGVLSGTNVQWQSDIDGPLGTGPIVNFAGSILSEGYHTITVTATDSAGLTNSAVTHLLALHYPPPQLAIKTVPPSGVAVLSWPSYYTNYVLQSSASLASGWSVITNAPPMLFGIQQIATVGLTKSNTFFRLMRRP